MKKTIFFLLISAFFFSGNTLKDNRLRPGKDFALFFAINDYDYWDDLANPVSDVEAIAKDLKDLYGFETEISRNPSRRTILDKIEEYRKKTYAEDAQLLIFFSGHGEFNEDTRQGYFVPKDGKKEDSYGDSYIEYEGLKRRISSLPCEHIMLALDACYSGTADESIAMRGKPGERPGTDADAERERYIATSLQYKTRLLLTSGAKERTPDKSQFVEKFLEALRSRGGQDGLLNIAETLGYLNTANPKPAASAFEEHEPGGEFLFIMSGIFITNTATNLPEKTDKTAFDLAAWKAASTQNTIEAYEHYQRSFCPDGAFCRLVVGEITKLRDQDKLAWSNALNKNNIEAYKKYVADFPSGWASEEAAARVAALEAPDWVDDDLIFVKGGSFSMGCQSKDCDSDEKPVHKVRVSDFYIGKYEVTQAEWRKVMGSDPPSLYNKGCDQCPVESVSWDNVQEFLEKINFQTGLNYRLPTEAEWEYSAQGGNLSRGSTYSGAVSFYIDIVAWYESNYDSVNKSGTKKSTQPVGRKTANELGLYDMSGNVYEWCNDWKGTYSSSEVVVDPIGPPSGTDRIVRGGSWYSKSQYCRISHRNSVPPNYRDRLIGFRLARSK